MLNTMTNTMLNTGSNTSGVTTFKSQPIITSTILANTDSSTNIATTAWSNAFWTYVKTQANTFSGTTTFSNTTNINTTGSATTTIGNILSTTNISGSVNISGAVNINTIGTTTTTIGNILSTTNISGNTINISGDLNINTGGTATTTIGNTAGATNVLGQVNIANDGLSATGRVNIATGSNVAGSEINIGGGSSTININRPFTLQTNTIEIPAITILKPNPQISIRHNNNPSRYDAFVIGFGSGGGSPASEAGASSGSNRFPDVTGNDTTGYCARIKCVSNVDHAFDYGSIGTFYFQGKNDNNWGGGVTSRGNYNTVCVMNPYLNRIGVNRTDSGSYTLDVNGLIRTASGFVNDSDRRIKANIIDVEDDEALQLLRRLKPKTYTYKDTNTKGAEPVYGFIAQEVREVISYSTSLSKDCIPNIYDKVTLVDEILTFSTFNTSDLAYDVSGQLFSSIKLLPYKESQGIILTITEIIDSHSVKIDLSTLPKNNAGDIITFDTELFVYGQEVNDFHSMKKDAIWTVATAALQEVDRQLQAEKEKTVQLGTTVNTLNDIVESLVLRITAIEQRTN